MGSKYSNRGLIYLSQKEIEKTRIEISTAIECMKEVLSLHDRCEVNMPSKLILDLDEKRHGRINAMPAHVKGDIRMCGMKWIAGFPNNPVRFGLPRANALIMLNNDETGMPLAIMEGTRISAMRTGAVTGLGASYLARKDSKSVAFIGAGVQSYTQFEALQFVLPSINEVRIFDIQRKTAETFVNNHLSQYNNISFSVADTPEKAVRDADVVVTVTVADEPIVKEEWLKDGVFFAHVGSYQEEEEAVILKADKVVVDIWEEVLHRKTPLIAKMYFEGKINESRIHANIGQIINGIKPGRESPDEKIFFAPLGLGSEDVALAARIYDIAFKQGLGLKLPFAE